MSKIQIRDLYKLFGKHADKAYDMLQGGSTLDEVRARYDIVPAVVDVSFDVEEGEIFVVMGLSGSGKSTLIRCINRLYEPTGGAVVVDGVDVTTLDHRDLRHLRLEKLGMVFQHFALFPHYTVSENVGWGLEVKGSSKAEIRTKALEALQMVGLEGWEDKYPHQLSGGMQQRVGLARAIATDSDIMLMDEAFSALDPLIRNEMQQQLVSLQDELKKTIVFITHDLNEAMFLGDHIAIMKDGRVEQIGTSEEILRSPATEYVADFVKQVDRSRVLTASSIMTEPVAVFPVREGPSAALKFMGERQLSALHILGPNKQLLGAVFDDDLIAAVKRGDKKLDQLLRTEIPMVDPDTLISDVLVVSAEYRLPLPVVEDGKLVGVLPRVALLLALGETATVGDDDEANETVREKQPETSAGSATGSAQSNERGSV